MTQNWRKIIFFLLVFIFLILAPTILLYSQGIRFDFEKKRFTFTGAIYLRALPRQVEVLLNGKLIKKTDLIFGSARIENLIPKKYLIEVKKEGYFPWKKELEVKEKKVTEATGIILFKTKIKFKKVRMKIKDFENLKKKEGISCKEILKSLGYGLKGIPQKDCFAQKIGENIFLISENNLYFFSFEKETFEKIFENLEGWEKFREKMVIFLPHEIWLFTKKGKEFLIRETEQIKDVAFLNENYLVFLVGKKIKIVETDTRDKLNIYEIGEIEGEKIAVNEKKEILLLNKGEISASDVLY
jgi:hypothetical protein